jgi:uncharacterized protein
MTQTLRLNLPDFCAHGEALEGGLAPESFPRLYADVVEVIRGQWRVRGRLAMRHELPEYEGQPLLDLSAEAILRVACVRCLEPVEVAVQVESGLVAVGSDAEADEALTEDDRYDAIVSSAQFDLAGLIEDEILMALPAQPRHEHCSPRALAALGLSADEEGVALQVPKDNPFAVLEALKKH